MKKIFTLEQELDICRLYTDELIGGPELAKRLGTSVGPIYAALKIHGVDRTHSLHRRKYHINEHAFDFFDEPAAYWYGFMWADGTVYLPENRVALGLATKDKNHVEYFREFLSADIKPRIYSKKMGPDIFMQYRLDFKCKHLAQRLHALGITAYRDNDINPFIEIDDPSLWRHWIRGLFDGDGSISISKPRIRFGARKKILQEIRSILYIFANANPQKTIRKAGKSQYLHDLDYQGRKQTKRIIEYIYGAATIYLDRKYAIARQF